MAVNPREIVERQLELLLAQSNKGSLTFEECQSLERLVKLQMLMRMKERKDSEDPFEDISTDELAKMLPLLSVK